MASVIASLMKSVFFSDCNYRRSLYSYSYSSSSFSGRRNNHPFLQVTRFTHETAYRSCSSSSFSGRGRRNNHPFPQVSDDGCSPISDKDDDLFLVLRYTHVITDIERELFNDDDDVSWHDLSWDLKRYYLIGGEKSYYFSLVSTAKGCSVRDFWSPHFNVRSFSEFDMSSCEGLVLLHHFRKEPEPILWNPQTNQFKAVPPSDVPRPFHLGHKSCFGVNPCCLVVVGGFGFDPKSRDYKIIRFVRSSNDCSQSLIEMYSLKNDSWKEISEDPTSHIFKSLFHSWCRDCDSDTNPPHPYLTGDGVCGNGVYANGCCHWLTTKGKIISFDFATESFSCISFPNTGKLFDPCGPHNKLVEFDGSLGVIFDALSRDLDPEVWILNAEVWILNDDRSSWTRKLKINHAFAGEVEGGWCDMLGFSSNNQLLFLYGRPPETGPRQLFAYDVAANQVNKFAIYEFLGFMELHPYFHSNLDFNM